MPKSTYFMNMFYNFYSIVFGHFGLCSKIKLRLRDATFEMHLSFYIWGYLGLPIFVKLIHVKTKQKYIFFIHILRNKVHKAQLTYLENIRSYVSQFA